MGSSLFAGFREKSVKCPSDLKKALDNRSKMYYNKYICLSDSSAI